MRRDAEEGWRIGARQAAIERGRKMLMSRGLGDEEFLAFSEGAASRFPESAEIQYFLAAALRYADHPDDEVAAQAAKAAVVGSRDPNMQVRAGYKLMDANDVDGARRCVSRAEEVADENFILAVDLDGLKGCIAARDGDLDEAEALFRSVVRRAPEWATNWTQLARFLRARHRDDEALAVLAEALSRLRETDDGSAARRENIGLVELLQAEIAADGRSDLMD